MKKIYLIFIFRALQLKILSMNQQKKQKRNLEIS